MRKKIFLSISLLFTINILFSQMINRVEPPSWWTGMKHPLRIMIYGEDLLNSTLTAKDSRIKVLNVKNGDNPNYVFADVKFDNGLSTGEYEFVLKNGKGKVVSFKYKIEGRKSSKKRTSFDSSDMIYLLMPDRFANGDVKNDNVNGYPDKSNRSDILGRHGGDLQGIINSLDYISSLGVTAIWSTPLLEDNEPKVSYHGYACSDYYKIDPRYGTNELYKKYVDEAAKRGIKIIQDFIPNHCGLSHWWVNDPPFKDWINTFPKYTQSNFAMTGHADIHAAEADKDLLIKGWFDTSMPDMNLKNEQLVTYFIQNMIWWVEWSGISGIRVDTYPYSDKYQIAKIMNGIRNEYPWISIVGECWYHSPQEIAYWEGGNKNKDGYDSKLTHVMDFWMQDMIFEAFLKDENPNWGEGMFKIHRVLALDYIYKNPYSLMIFADNHDTNRISELIKKNPSKLKMILSLLATMRGIPQLYYGTEIMMATKDGVLGHGQERMDMPGGWDGDAKNVFKGENLSNIENDILNHTRKVFGWRKTSKVIHDGKLTHYWPIDNVYVYFRYNTGETVMTIINNNVKPIAIDWSRYKENIKNFKGGIDIISEKEIKFDEKFEVPGQTSMIVELK